MRDKFRAAGVAFLTCSALLTGCGSLAIYAGVGLPSSEVVMLKGFVKDYLIYSEQIEIATVDWQKPKTDWFVSEAQFLPGRHSIGIFQNVYSWSSSRTACVVEGDFQAGHTYKFSSFSSSPDVHWYEALPAQYKGSIGVEVSTPDSNLPTMQLETECSRRDWLCNQDADCPNTTGHGYLCKRVSEFKYGLCEQQRQ
jgi:hypothetical protein